MTQRRKLAAAAAAVALLAVAGAFGAAGLVANDAPGTDSPTDTPTDPPTATEAPNGTTLAQGADGIVLQNDPKQVVPGTTDLPAGTELVVRLKNTNGSTPFIKQTSVTVAENGSFRATFDLSGIPAGTTFEAVVRHDDETLTNVSGRVVEGVVPVSSPTDEGPKVLEYEGDAVTLRSSANQTVAGTTDLPAGSEVVVRLRSSNSEQPFIKQTTATVGEDGRFAATFNMSDIEPGTRFTVVVRHDGETLDEAAGKVVDGN